AVRGDQVEEVRAEAAHALWNAPRCFGTQTAAAETLASILDRAPLRSARERSAWLALDAPAGPPHPALRAAATPPIRSHVPQLRDAARRAAAGSPRDRDSQRAGHGI